MYSFTASTTSVSLKGLQTIIFGNFAGYFLLFQFFGTAAFPLSWSLLNDQDVRCSSLWVVSWTYISVYALGQRFYFTHLVLLLLKSPVHYLVFLGATCNRSCDCPQITLYTYKITFCSSKRSRLLWPTMMDDNAPIEEANSLKPTKMCSLENWLWLLKHAGRPNPEKNYTFGEGSGTPDSFKSWLTLLCPLLRSVDV